MGNIHLTKANKVEEERHKKQLKSKKSRAIRERNKIRESILTMLIENNFDESKIPQGLIDKFNKQKGNIKEANDELNNLS